MPNKGISVLTFLGFHSESAVIQKIFTCIFALLCLSLLKNSFNLCVEKTENEERQSTDTGKNVKTVRNKKSK